MRVIIFKYLSLLLCIFCAFSAQADDLHFEGNYVFSWSGIRIGNLHLEMDQDDSDYEIASNLKTSGIVAMFSDHKSFTKVKGKSKGSQFKPRDYRSNYYSGKKDKVIALKYDANGKIINEEITPPKRASRPEVPEDMKIGAADSLTAIFSMREEIKTALAKGETEMTVPVFDGKRRFDLHARILNPSTSLTLNGDKVAAIKLGLRRTPVAGFKDKELKKLAKGEPELEFFVDQKNLTLLGLQMPLYGGTVMAWVKNACVNEACDPNQMASK
ncbi:MAG: DUF3108 domain-containing protein [Rickettsiales bacterium]|nr:DUF3108 domain-containing protein [Rickettsiales bacterium]